MILLCLLAGTTFWLLNALNKNYNTKINYPITFVMDNPDSLVVVKELPEKVQIDVSGGGWNLLRKTYWFNINPITIPLNNPTQIRYILGKSLEPIISDQLSEISLNYVATDSLFLHIDEKISKNVHVTIDSNSVNLKPSYRIVSQIQVNPVEVVFSGPSTLVNALEDTINLALPSNIDADFSDEISITPPSSELITFSPNAVNVSFEVARFVRETTVVDVRPINFPNDTSYMLLDDKVEVIYTVQEEKMDQISEENFQILANFRNFDARDSSIDATLGMAPEIILDLKVNPKKLRVKRNIR